VLVQLRDEIVADAEGFNGPEGNTAASGMGKGADGPPESSGHGMQEERRRRTWEAPEAPRWLDRSLDGIQVLRHARGNPETELDWNLSGGTKDQRGRRRSTVKGNARRMPLGCLIRHSTPSAGKPRTWGRT
jgi:hypothetical protein